MNEINNQKQPAANLIEQIDQALLEDERAKSAVCADRSERHAMSKLARILRILGTLTLISSALTFMVQQWDSVSHIERYFYFLGFTLLLSVSGFMCGLRIKEDKSARTLLALAAAVIPVHFCQLGALLYSIWPYKQHGIVYPAYFSWIAPNATSAMLTCIVGIAALIPICLISFAALARGEARRISALYLAANALLLIPTRNPDAIGLMALALSIGLVSVEVYSLRSSAVMRTRESMFIRLMLWTPLATLIGRTLQLYPTSDLLTAAIFTIVSCVLLFLIPGLLKNRGDVELSRCLSLPPLLFAFWYLSIDMRDRLEIDRLYQIPLAFTLFSGTLWKKRKERK